MPKGSSERGGGQKDQSKDQSKDKQKDKDQSRTSDRSDGDRGTSDRSDGNDGDNPMVEMMRSMQQQMTMQAELLKKLASKVERMEDLSKGNPRDILGLEDVVKERLEILKASSGKEKDEDRDEPKSLSDFKLIEVKRKRVVGIFKDLTKELKPFEGEEGEDVATWWDGIMDVMKMMGKVDCMLLKGDLMYSLVGTKVRRALIANSEKAWSDASLEEWGKSLKDIFQSDGVDHRSVFSKWSFDSSALYSVNLGTFLALADRAGADEKWKCEVWMRGIPEQLALKVAPQKLEWIAASKPWDRLGSISRKKWDELESTKKIMLDRNQNQKTNMASTFTSNTTSIPKPVVNFIR